MKARLAAALLIAFALGLTLLHVVDPHPFAAPLSAFSVGPFGWLYRVAFFAAAAALAMVAFATAGWGRIAAGVASAGAALAALIPSEGVPVTRADRIHLAGTLAFLVGSTVMTWFGRTSLSARLLAIAASVLLIGTVALKAQHSSYAGLAQRLLVALLVVGLWSAIHAAVGIASAASTGGASPRTRG